MCIRDSRPGFYEIVPYQIMGEEYQEKGNPSLKRARIDNIDLRWEWFPSKTCLLYTSVSYLSYKTREMVVDVAKKAKVDIPMDEDLKQLGEVVVTGHREYGLNPTASLIFR